MVSLKEHDSKLNRNDLGGHLTLIAYKSFFIFNQRLYRQTDSIAKFFPLGQDFESCIVMLFWKIRAFGIPNWCFIQSF